MRYKTCYHLCTVRQYLSFTDEKLTSRCCKALGLSEGKCYLSKLRAALESYKQGDSICSPFENLPTKVDKSRHEQPVKVLIASHLSDVSIPCEFTTKDISSLRTVPRSTIAKAIRELIRDGRIEVVDDEQRPKVYRWIPEERPDVVDVFMKVNSIGSEKSVYQFSLAQLPCHLNRSLCGLPYLGDNLTIRIRERLDEPTMNNVESACVEAGIARLLPYVISSAGDYRVFNRRVEDEISLTKKIRKLLSRIDVNGIRRESLETRCLSDVFISYLESENGKQHLYQYSQKFCGDKIHLEEVNVLLPKITRDMCQEFPSLSYDKGASSLVSKEPINRDMVESALTKTMRMYAQKSDKTLKKVNVKDIYREAARELKQQTNIGS